MNDKVMDLIGLGLVSSMLLLCVALVIMVLAMAGIVGGACA